MRTIAKVLITEFVVEDTDGVKYRHHPNGGGLVAETASVAPTAVIGPDAFVCDRAQVLEHAVIDAGGVSGNAVVLGHAKVRGGLVSDHARVFGHAVIDGGEACGRAQVFGNARVSSGAIVKGDARVGGDVQLSEGTYEHGMFGISEGEVPV